MIAANEAVARLLSERGTPALYRVHERPEPERVRAPDRAARVARRADAAGSRAAVAVAGGASCVRRDLAAASTQHVRRTRPRARPALTSLRPARRSQQAHYSPTQPRARRPAVGRATATSPRRSAAIPTWSAIARCCRRLASDESAPQAGALQELGVWTSERERDAMTIERDADDVARCFAAGATAVRAGLRADLRRRGDRADLGRSVHRVRRPRLQRRPSHAAIRGHAAGTPAARRAGDRDWWELNEQGTILHGERSGATLRLGDPVEVRVARVDAPRGRVDLGRRRPRAVPR